MFATVYVIDMPGGEPEAALVGIGEPSAWALMDDDQKLADERVFYYFESLDEIRTEHADWDEDTWFIVAGIDLPCYLCTTVDDGGNTLHTVQTAPDAPGERPGIETVAKCRRCIMDDEA